MRVVAMVVSGVLIGAIAAMGIGAVVATVACAFLDCEGGAGIPPGWALAAIATVFALFLTVPLGVFFVAQRTADEDDGGPADDGSGPVTEFLRRNGS